MAGEKCSLTCNIRDSKGNIKVSTLWKELSRFFKEDRRQAVAHYFLTKDNNFLLENSNVLEFDVDGEVTIVSLKKALEAGGEYTKLSNSVTLGLLNEELRAGKYDYSEALDNVLKFNRSNQFREGFMATLKRDADGKYSIKVVERNPTSEYELAGHVQNKILTDAIRLLLKDKGLSVEFLDNPSYAVQYSTNNVHLDADGLMAVAQVLNGINSSKEVAEAAGHFIIAAMQDSPLVQRLINMLTPEVQAAIFSNKKSEMNRDDFLVSDYSAKEAAGILLGRQLIEPFNQMQKSKAAKIGIAIPKGINMLLNKIGNFIKKILKIPYTDVQGIVQRAKAAASTAAEGFITNPEEADVSLALNTEETYASGSLTKKLSDDVRESVGTFNNALNDLKTTIAKLRESVKRTESPTNRDILNKLRSLSKGVEANYSPQMSLEVFARGASLEGMVVILEGVTQILDTDIRSLLDQIQPSDRIQSYANISENARNLRTVNTTLKNMAILSDTIKKKLESLNTTENVQYEDADGNQVTTTLADAIERLDDVLIGNDELFVDTHGRGIKAKGLVGVMESKRRQVFIDAMREFYGSDFIERNAGKVFMGNWFNTKLVTLKGDNNKYYVSDLIDYLEEDISLWDRYFSSAADCGDFVTAVGDKVTKNANMLADRNASRYWDTIEELRLQMQDAFGNTDCSVLFEVIEDVEGHKTKTGNFVSEVNYGAWEAARHEFKEQLKVDFNNYLAELRMKAYERNKGVPGYVFSLTEQQKAVLYHSFIDPLWEKWHNEHSELDPTVTKGKRYIPNHIKYHNSQWDDLFDVKNPGISAEERAARAKRLKWYNALMEMKAEMDSMLPKNATVLWRAPQFVGRFSHRYRNLKAQMNNSKAAFGRALRSKAQDLYAIREDEAWMFGSNNDFNEIGEDPFENPLFFEKEKINRLPLYGINKLKDMSLLSTDLFGTLMSYGSMAATYQAMSSVVDIFELGADQLKERKIGKIASSKEKDDRRGATRAYSRYIKFLEKQVYQINVTPPKIDKLKMWIKIANGLSSLGSRILLWGNVHGGIVNTGTGMIEILKEAWAGENFNTSELLEAHKIYLNGLFTGSDGGIWATMGNGLLEKQRPMDKNSLWIRHWNILSENRAFLHHQKFDTNAMSLMDNRFWEWFNHSMMLPYSSGDHYMQTIPYYAMGIHTKVYDHDGNQLRLMDAYEVVDGKEVFDIEKTYGTPLGKTPKKIKLKDGIFKSPQDIIDYDKVQNILGKIENFFTNNPTINNSSPVALDMFSDAEREYLEKNEFSAPANVKELDNLKNALQLKSVSLMYNEDDESAFMDKCRNICNRLHGIYNTQDKVAFQQNFYGNLVMAMRGYALGMVNRRFARNKFNVPQGKSVEGSYVTTFKMLASAIWDANSIDNWKAIGESLLLCVPFGNLALFNKGYGNKLKADMLKAGWSEHQYYNMRRTGADFLILEALALMNFLAAPGRHFGLTDWDDEDKNNKNDSADNWAAGMLYYFTMRWFNEQGAFSWPSSFLNEGNSVLDYIPAGLSGARAIYDILELYAETLADKADGIPDYENSKLYYKSSKKGKYQVRDSKAKIKFLRLCPYIRSWYAMSHPYDAASSYEYGRRVRGK